MRTAKAQISFHCLHYPCIEPLGTAEQNKIYQSLWSDYISSLADLDLNACIYPEDTFLYHGSFDGLRY